MNPAPYLRYGNAEIIGSFPQLKRAALNKRNAIVRRVHWLTVFFSFSIWHQVAFSYATEITSGYLAAHAQKADDKMPCLSSAAVGQALDRAIARVIGETHEHWLLAVKFKSCFVLLIVA